MATVTERARDLGRKNLGYSVVGYPVIETPIRPVTFTPHEPVVGVEVAFKSADRHHKRHPHH
jgi:hypothetical protein